jgi:hypothetical protein
MNLKEFQLVVSDFSEKSHGEKIKLFGWYLQVHQKRASFQSSDLRGCYDALSIAPPLSFSGYLENLVKQKMLLRNSAGYRLEGRVHDLLDKQYAGREITVQVTNLLLSLPDNIPDLAERTFLDETLICFRNEAFRAAIVMAWNLTYHHLCDYVLKKHLDEFNNRWPVVYPAQHKKGPRSITSMDDFAQDLKESEVIEICKSAGIITKDVHKILAEKLGRRNSAAHPSSVKFGQLQVEAFIEDLVTNVVLKLV